MRGSVVVVGVIVARSVDVPSAPDAITYTVEVDESGIPERYAGVKPKDDDRISSEYPDFNLELVPFKIGQEVPVSIRAVGTSERLISIMKGEFAAIEECGS